MKVRPIIYSSLLVAALCVVAFAQGGRFAVQLGASPDRAEAETKLKDAQGQKLDAYLVKSEVPGKGIFYRVRVGNYASRAAAEKAAQQFKASGAVSEYFIAAYETPEAAPAAVMAKATPTPARVVAVAPVTAAPATVAPKATPTPMVAAKPAATPAAATNNGMPSLGNTAGNVATAKPTPSMPAPTTPNRPATTPPSTSATPGANPVTKPAGTASVLGGYTRFLDEGVGYSFEHPAYWVGGPLSSNEVQTAKNSGGAMFKSNEDQAFLNAIWNKLDKANSTEHDNDMIVDLILKSMATGNGTQNMTATNRTVITEGPLIKTFLDLKAAFVVPNQTSPLDFIGKGVIIRASKGILLVVTFYSKDAPQTVAMAADHIIKTTRTPE
ncbi:MAG: hypothetical protein HOP19_16485 [Acidobacteria bacterium]|nr:hypothetical protein [Acidobacteriota bacterium]